MEMVALWAALTTGIIVVFEAIQKASTTNAGTVAANVLVKLTLAQSSMSWRLKILSIFDMLYGTKYYGPKFLFRTLITTSICVFLSLLFLIFIVGPYLPPADDPGDYTTGELLVFYGVWYVVAVIVNFFPDYFSLIETRLVIGEMQKSSSKFSLVFFIFFDFFLTTAIYTLASTFVCTLLLVIHMNYYDFNLVLVELHPSLSSELFDGNDTFVMFLAFALFLGFLSTYFTSIWIAGYFFCSVLYRVAKVVKWPLSKLKRNLLDIESHPFRSIGILLSFLFSIVYFIYVLFIY